VKSMTGRSIRAPCLQLRPLCSMLNPSTHRLRRPRQSMRIHTQHHIQYRYRTRIIPIPGTLDTMADLGYTWACRPWFLTSDSDPAAAIFALDTADELVADTSAGIAGVKTELCVAIFGYSHKANRRVLLCASRYPRLSLE
jgi:hypothetical protein